MAKPNPKTVEKTTSFGDDLYVVVKKLKRGGVSRHWAYRFKDASGNRQLKQFGSVENMTITEARDFIKALVRKFEVEALDPRDATATGEVPQFHPFALEYIADKCAHVSPKERESWVASVEAVPSLHKLPVNVITINHVHPALAPMWQPKAEGGKPVFCRSTRQRLCRIFAGAKVKGLRKGDNPADLEGLRELMAPMKHVHKKKGHPAVHYARMPILMQSLRYDDSRIARVVEFAILTCARSKEARLIEWKHLNLTSEPQLMQGSEEERLIPPNTWLVPGDLMKMKRDHIVPLSDAAVAILRAQPRVGKYVFPSDADNQKGHAPFFPNALSRCLERAGANDGTMHGCRTTFRTWGGDSEANYHHDVLEFCIAHVTGDETVKAYWRGTMVERRRVVMDDWAAFAMSKVPAPRRVLTNPHKVVPMVARAA